MVRRASDSAFHQEFATARGQDPPPKTSGRRLKATDERSSEGAPIVLPLTVVKADVYLQSLTTLLMGGNGRSRPGGNLGL